MLSVLNFLFCVLFSFFKLYFFICFLFPFFLVYSPTLTYNICKKISKIHKYFKKICKTHKICKTKIIVKYFKILKFMITASISSYISMSYHHNMSACRLYYNVFQILTMLRSGNYTFSILSCIIMKGLFLWTSKNFYQKQRNAIPHNKKYLIHQYLQNKLKFSICLYFVSQIAMKMNLMQELGRYWPLGPFWVSQL